MIDSAVSASGVCRFVIVCFVVVVVVVDVVVGMIRMVSKIAYLHDGIGSQITGP